MDSITDIGGLDLKFFNDNLFETENSDEVDVIARNTLRVLLMGGSPQWKNLITMKVFKAVFIERNFELAKALRGAFQIGIRNVFTQLQDATLTESQIKQANAYINTCLMYTGYFELNPYEILALPQYIDDKWVMVNYIIDHIKLTPDSYIPKDEIYISCYTPIDNPKAPAILGIPGTTFPQGQGFISTIEADLEPFQTPGQKLFERGLPKIERWLDQQDIQGHKVQVIGTSLGGAIGLLIACEFPEKIAKVYAFNPPGIYAFNKRPKQFSKLDNAQIIPEVNVFLQNNDEVSKFGLLHERWNAYRVIPPQDKLPGHRVADHVVSYLGFAESQFIPIDIELHNKIYNIRNIVWYTCIRAIFSFFIFKPFRHIALPLIRFIDNEILSSIFTLPFLVLCGFFAVTLNPVLMVLFFTAIGFFFTRLIFSDNTILKELFCNTKNSFLKVSIVSLTAVLIIASAIATLFIPPLIAFSIAVALPLISAIFGYIVALTQRTFHKEETPGIAHLPNMPRHPDLCTYRNMTRKDFTYEQLFDYYFDRRCNVKGRPFIDDNTKSQGLFLAHEYDDEDNMIFVRKTKTEILRNSINPEFKDKVVTRVASIAKINAMKKFTLFKEHPEFGQDLRKIDIDYQAGKAHSEPLIDVDYTEIMASV